MQSFADVWSLIITLRLGDGFYEMARPHPSGCALLSKKPSPNLSAVPRININEFFVLIKNSSLSKCIDN
jgi:hypothetical protein